MRKEVATNLETAIIQSGDKGLSDAFYELKKALDDYIPPKSKFGAWICWQEIEREIDGGKYTFKSPKRMVLNRTKKKRRRS